MRPMQHGVAAIRAARSRARFVLAPMHRRERRLGLHRTSMTPPATATAGRSGAARDPMKQVLDAARRLSPTTSPPARPAERRTSVAHGLRMHWTQTATGPRRSATASPWRD